MRRRWLVHSGVVHWLLRSCNLRGHGHWLRLLLRGRVKRGIRHWLWLLLRNPSHDVVRDRLLLRRAHDRVCDWLGLPLRWRIHRCIGHRRELLLGRSV